MMEYEDHEHVIWTITLVFRDILNEISFIPSALKIIFNKIASSEAN